MIYVCIPSHNEAATIGLLLWKIRQVFAGFPREYQLLVLDDGSTDATSDVLEPYSRVLPLTLVRHAERQGYAASVQELLRDRDRADRSPQARRRHPDARRLHPQSAGHSRSGPADRERCRSGRRRRHARGRAVPTASACCAASRPQLLRGAVAVPGVHDVVSGFAILRLVALRNAMRSHGSGFLVTDGWAANAELYWRTGRYARRVESVPSVERHDLRQRPSRDPAGGGGDEPLARAVPAPRPRRSRRRPSRSARDTERQAEAVS